MSVFRQSVVVVVGHIVDLPPAHSSLARCTPSSPSCRPSTVLPCERELSTRLFSDSSPGHPSMTPKCPSFGCKTEHLGYFTFGVHSPHRITPHTKPDRVEPSQPPSLVVRTERSGDSRAALRRRRWGTGSGDTVGAQADGHGARTTRTHPPSCAKTGVLFIEMYCNIHTVDVH
jgi:hypothetical protein